MSSYIIDMNQSKENLERDKNYSLQIKTVQSSIFKTLIESVKELLPDTNLDIDKNGVKILSMDPTHTVLVHVHLHAENFELYYCDKKCIVGLSMTNLFKLMKTVTNNDTLMLFMEHNDPNHLGIRIENGCKNCTTTYKLNLMDLNEDSLQIPPAIFPAVITMRASEFQKVCRDTNNFS